MRFINALNYLLLSVTTVFLVCVFFHDNGVPKSITESEKQHVLDVVAEAELHQEAIIRGMEEFVLYPDEESRISCEIIAAFEELRPCIEEASVNPVFFVGFEECIPVAERFKELNERSLVAGDDMATELARRVEAGDWDREVYKELQIAFESCVCQEAACCTPADCGWCRCHNRGFVALAISSIGSLLFACACSSQ